MIHLIAALLMFQEPAALDKVELAAASFKTLDDRLLLRMPEGAIEEARQHSIMAAPEPNTRETRLVWTSGERKVVVMVYELFQTAGADYQAQLKKLVAGWKVEADISAVRERPGLRVCTVTPRKLDASRDAVFTLAAYTALADGSVQSVVVYVNPKAAQDPAGCAALAAKIGDSIASGTRKLSAEAGTQVIQDLGQARRVVLDVPVGFTMTVQRGPDFHVVSITKIVPLGELGPSFNAYFGGHPGYQHARQDEKPKVRTVEGFLLGEPARWHHWNTEGDDARHYKEAMGAVPGNDRLIIHIFLVAPGAEALAAVDALLTSLRIEQKK